MILCTACNGTGCADSLYGTTDCASCHGQGEVAYRDEKGRFVKEPACKDPRFA